MEHEDSSHYEHHESHETPHKKKDMTEKLRTNPWIISTFVLGILAIILIIGSVTGGITGKTISEDKAADLVLGFVESQVGGEVELISVSSESGLYKVTVLFQGSEVPLYVTKDGKNLVTGGVIPLSLLEQTDSQQTQQASTPEVIAYSEDDLVKLSEFSSCLAEKGLIIYGANWCGWTKKLAIDTLGGFDIAGDAYIECTEEEELCSSEGVTGYPTVKLNGESYSGGRTLEALGEATGCSVPELEGTGVAASSSEASCN